MKIIFLCGGGEGAYSSSQGFLHALKSLGHEVWSLGRRYYDRCLTDMELPHREHPEYYSYDYILSQCPWTPDLAICFDPGGYFLGDKPQGLKSIFISTDAHRNGEFLRRAIRGGSYDLFVNMQPNYTHFFTDLVKVYTTIPAFDDRRFDIKISNGPVCDCAFIGQTGLAFTKEHWENPDGQDEVGKYISNLASRLPNDPRKYEFAFLPSYDYSERGELLYRLSQDFDVRIYETIWDERLQLALQKGRLGFNHSILNDISIRLMEYSAAGRMVAHDDITLMTEDYAYMAGDYVGGLYKPFYSNFDLQYEDVRKTMRCKLDYMKDWGNLAESEKRHVFANHTWKNRASEILKTLEE